MEKLTPWEEAAKEKYSTWFDDYERGIKMRVFIAGCEHAEKLLTSQIEELKKENDKIGNELRDLLFIQGKHKVIVKDMEDEIEQLEADKKEAVNNTIDEVKDYLISNYDLNLGELLMKNSPDYGRRYSKLSHVLEEIEKLKK